MIADSNKPAEEVIFSRKNKVQVDLTINLGNIQVERTFYQKHLGILLDEKFNFKQRIDSVIPKINNVIFVIKKTQTFFTTEISTCNISNFSEASNSLWRYHL